MSVLGMHTTIWGALRCLGCTQVPWLRGQIWGSCGHLEWSKNMQRTWLHQLIMYDFKCVSLKIKTGPRHRAEGRYDKTLRPLHLFNGK